MARIKGFHQRGRTPVGRPREQGKFRLGLVLVLVVLLGVATFFALGGDVDSDVKGGNVEVESPKGDIDVNKPDVNIKEPDINIDPGGVDVKEPPPADADAETGDVDN